jgi:Sensors of blue-light using FAD
MSLECIVYVSSAVGRLADADLEAVLAKSRRRNQDQHVTGALLYHEGSFIQYFEGPPNGVADVYGHIRRSPLHCNIIELERTPVRERQFPAWLMGFTRAPKSTVLRLSGASWHSAVHDAKQSRSEGMDLLLAFWRTNGAV